MAVRLRLKRTGRKNRACFRLVAMDGRTKRDGKSIEDLGSYDPEAAPESKYQLKVDRITYWLSVGAQPSDPVAAILRKAKIDVQAARKAGATKPGPSETT